MKTLSALYTITLLAGISLFQTACSSDSMPVPDLPTENKPAEILSAYQEKIRTQPYPKTDNDIFINPAPLIVPQVMKTGECLQFTLSTSPAFDDENTFLSQPQSWCMLNLHRTLPAGTYYWRFRSTDAQGNQPGEWSQTYQFSVKSDTPSFLTPDFKTFQENAPRYFPRLYCFLNGRIEEARHKVTSHPEYKQLTSRAQSALNTDYTAMPVPYTQSKLLSQHTSYLYQAYHLLQTEEYANKLYQLLSRLLQTPPTDSELLTDNFTSTDILYCHAAAYDLLHNRLSESERQATEALMLRVVRHFYQQNCGMEENHLFDNHFWQQNMRIVFQALFLLYDHPIYRDEVLPMLEYYYELWTARAPAGGFNRDGLWHNGTGYFTANVKTLTYMPALLSYITRTDFLQHPWYQHAGQALVYSFPPHSKSNGFGDGSEKNPGPNRLTAAFADYLARETQNSYAGWYAQQCQSLITQDYELRLYRMCADRDYQTYLPYTVPILNWYQDIGEVAMHTNLQVPEEDLALSFRSSTFGSGSHTTASQNAFNLLFRGTDVYRSSGYYQNFSDAHNLMSYRHTRAHNTILVNGIGQPYSTEGYGYIPRALSGEHIGYCLGNASHAYNGISKDPMWENYFAMAGIAQSPENGFGPTPLTRYERHMILLVPDIVVVYDVLEASESVTWDWLLHSSTQMKLNEQDWIVSLHQKEKQFIATAQLFSQHPLTCSLTDAFRVPPTITGEQYPNQWHLTARITGEKATRILAVMQVRDESQGSYIIRQKEGRFEIGSWILEAELDANTAPKLTVKNKVLPCTFGYTPENGHKSVLYDQIEGKWQTQEMNDCLPAITRAKP